jgi:hypothetical protein
MGQAKYKNTQTPPPPPPAVETLANTDVETGPNSANTIDGSPLVKTSANWEVVGT